MIVCSIWDVVIASVSDVGIVVCSIWDIVIASVSDVGIVVCSIWDVVIASVSDAGIVVCSIWDVVISSMFSYRTLCSVFELVKKTEDILVSDIEFEFLSFAVLLL